MPTLSKFSTKAALCLSSVALASGILTPRMAQAMTLTDSELYLSVDVSGSVNNSEFELQRQGYARAFQDSAVQQLISNSQNGIAAALGYWSSSSQQTTAVPFTLLRTAQDASSFASLISATTRPFSGGTSPGPAISFAANELLTNQFDGARLVIDVSGDGSGSTSATSAARDAAVANGITINGLPIGSSFVTDFYRDNVQGGAGSFTVPADTFNDFDTAVVRKISQEIAQVPVTPTVPSTQVPTPALLPGLIGMGVAAMRKRKAEGQG